MSGPFVKRTQESLGRVIKKPPLTEKLLSKPPFRYLHDIFTEVIRTTGFLKGLYTEFEMKSDNVKLSSDESVRRVLSGEKIDLKAKALSSSKSQGKENREKKDDERKRQKDKEQEERNENGIKHTSGDRKEKEQSKEQGKAMDKERDRHKDGDRREKGKEHERDRARTKERDQENHKNRGDGEKVEKDKNREGEKVEKNRIRGDGEKDKERSKERERNKDKVREKRQRDKEREHSKDQGRDQEAEREKAKEQDKTDRRLKVAAEEKPHKLPPEVMKKDSKIDTDQEAESPVRIPRPSSAKGQRRKPKPGVEVIDVSIFADLEAAHNSIEKKHTAEVNGEIPDELSPQVAQSRRVPRPGSARPAPPRIKKQESSDSPSERIGSAKPVSNVIVDKGKNVEEEEDDDEQFVVEEAVSQLPDMPEMEPATAVELHGSEDHGVLVRKILETKKDYESSKSATKPKDQEKTIISETAKKKERELVAKEIEKLRTSIQTLCRSALPLGKIMDYIQEDMDSMQNELSMWRRENKKHAESLLREQSITDTAVEPLKTELAELEQLIKDQQDKNCAVKANILKNEDKIQKMISSINFSSRT
ncbi:TRAF3-interacting protein 1 isoform X6 [Cetorhinus maximus]